MNMVVNTPRNICWGYLLELPQRGNSSKYPQHIVLGVYKVAKPNFPAFKGK